jgi:ubiquinone/menaquinone biosynthesis C-methylase UbiE
MTQDTSIPVFDWFSNQHTIEARAAFVKRIGPVLTSLFRPGDRILDLGCGAGAIGFFLADQGGDVTGIDCAPGLIAKAREEAARRNSATKFIQGNVLTCPLRSEEYDLAICLGNVVSDFPHSDFPRFRDSVYHALKPGGRLVVHYHDGLSRLKAMSEPKEVMEEGAEGQISRRFKEYDPSTGAFTADYRNLTTGETYEATCYIYTAPMIRILLDVRFAFDRSMRLSESRFFDVFVKR